MVEKNKIISIKVIRQKNIAQTKQICTFIFYQSL